MAIPEKVKTDLSERLHSGRLTAAVNEDKTKQKNCFYKNL